VSPLYLHNNKLIVVGGSLGASRNCCCENSSSSSSSSTSNGSDYYFNSLSSNQACNDCYKIDYVWNLKYCPPFGDPDFTIFTGSILLNQAGIVCYNGDATTGDAYGVVFENVCGEGSVSLYILCGSETTTIYTFGTYYPFPYFIPGNLCCGGGVGSYSFSENSEYETLSISVSVANSGSCDCSGYTTTS